MARQAAVHNDKDRKWETVVLGAKIFSFRPYINRIAYTVCYYDEVLLLNNAGIVYDVAVSLF